MTNEWGEVWYYKYDALGRRIEKACPQRNTKTTYLWDGDQVAYQETEKHGKTESKRHSIFNGWELIALQDCYFKTDLRNHHKTWTQTTNYAVCQPNGQPLALFNPQGKRTWRKAQTVYGVCHYSKVGKANKLSLLTQICSLQGNILTKKVD